MYSPTTTMRDLDRLIAHLRNFGEPDRSWLQDGNDPLVEIWQGCAEAEPLVTLLRVGGEVGAFVIDGLQEWHGEHGVERWLFRMRVAGRYYRIDVRRDDGGDAVRGCFPDFPNSRGWTELIAENRAAMSPLHRLDHDLRWRRAVTAGEDAQRAWSECDEPFLMINLLRRLGWGVELRAIAEALPAPGCEGGLLGLEWRRGLAARIRQRFFDLPPRRE